MKSFIFLICLLTIHTFLSATVNAQEEIKPDNIAILPLYSNGIDPVYIETAESILRVEIGKLSSKEIISTRRVNEILGEDECIESECAIEIGKEINASEVLGCRLSALGEKIIAQYFLVDVATEREVLVDQITSTNIEELETVMKRIAKSVVDIEPADKNVEVGTILEGESEEPLRRSSRKNVGLSFGYLYPQNGYDESSRYFVVDMHLDYEMEEFAAGMLLGIRDGFAVNLYGSYLFTKTDFCPYVGGAFGFHWVLHDDIFSDDRRTDGFELTANTGIRILHTYNFQIIVNLEYNYTLNDYDDQSIVFTIGIL
jgi:hypothetical protein